MKGRASELTDLGDGRLLRRGGDPGREAALMGQARRHGYPVPAVHEVREDALVLERLEGRTMLADLRRRPWLLRAHMRTLARLHDELHAVEHPDSGARLFRRHFDPDAFRRALPEAIAYRLADPNVTSLERAHVERLRGRYR